MTLAIDIGIKNLGYAILDDTLSFGIYDLSQHNSKHSIVIQRISKLYDFIEDLIEKYDIHKVIIERQVQKNTIAMELMYSIISIFYSLNIRDIILFDPKLKFTKLKQSYNTKNKNHKKLSIRIAELLLQYNNIDLLEFLSYSKKDDISDAILMLYLETTSNEDINNFILYINSMFSES